MSLVKAPMQILSASGVTRGLSRVMWVLESKHYKPKSRTGDPDEKEPEDMLLRGQDRAYFQVPPHHKAIA